MPFGDVAAGQTVALDKTGRDPVKYLSTGRLNEGLDDQNAYRAMTSAVASEKHLPELVVDARLQQPAQPAKDTYKQQERARAESYERKHEQGSTLDRIVLTIAAMPQDMAITTKPGQLKIESNDFCKVAEAIPGAELDKTIRAILVGMKSANLDGSKVTLEGKVVVPMSIAQGDSIVKDGMPGPEAKLNNPSFTIVPDVSNPNCIRLENITGVSAGAIGLDTDLKRVCLTLKDDGRGGKNVVIEFPAPEQKADGMLAQLGQWGQQLKSSVMRPITIPLDSADGKRVVEQAFASVADWAKKPDQTNPADLAAGVAGIALKSVMGGVLNGITSVSKKGDLLEITRAKGSANDFGGLPIEIAQTVKAKIENNGKGMTISQIEGVCMNLPVPPEVAKALALPQPFKANLKEAEIGEPDKDGNRILTVKTDSLLESVQVKVGRDMKPVTDAKGNICLDLNVKDKDVVLPLSVTFNPQQLEKPPAGGPDFKISIKGGDANCVKLIESISAGKIEAPLKDMVSNVTAISKQGDRISITRDKSSSHDLGGVILDAGKDIQFKIAPDGPSGFRLSHIEGINLKLPVQLPQMVKDAGIDPGDNIYTGLKTLNLSSPDSQGRRKLLVETNNLLNQVGVLLGPDMKPALDPKGNWYMYGFVDNPVANQKMPLVLRFDQQNQLAMSPQELMRMGSLAAWQGKDNGGLEGAGFAAIGVATEAGAIALDVKDKVVEVAGAVKDTVVEGAVTAGEAIKDGVVVAGDAVADGATTVGGWFSSGWHYLRGD